MRFIAVFIFAILFSACGSGQVSSTDTAGTTETAANASFVEDSQDLEIDGVSPEAILLENGSVRLYVTSGGIQVYSADDGLSFVSESAATPTGSDPTIIPLLDGSYRMYYVDLQEIRTATSDDGLAWTTESQTGITNENNGPWGVPDTAELSDGSIRMFWVDLPSDETLEVVVSATSADGTTFTAEEGYRTTGGYVDPYILSSEDGHWLALFSTTPTDLPQQIHLGSSENGLTWDIDNEPIITVDGGNALDPTAVPLSENSYRVYYSATPTSDAGIGHFLKSGVLTVE